MHFCSIKEEAKKQHKDYFFHADGSHSSEEENENKANTSSLSKESTKLPNPFSLENVQLLPSPSFVGTNDSTNSVFVTSFQRAEEAKQLILERHVKMTTPLKEEKRPQQKKKSVCRSFQLGKCRYGYRCRYGHDITPDTNAADGCTFSGATDSNHFGYSVDFGNTCISDVNNPKDSDDDDFRVEQKRRTRSGVSDTLIPPKRALVALDRQRQTDRPWTSTLKKQ